MNVSKFVVFRNGLFASRNTSYFVTLIVLVIFVFLFYLYNNASNDAANLRREINAQSEHIAKLKNEILGWFFKFKILINFIFKKET